MSPDASGPGGSKAAPSQHGEDVDPSQDSSKQAGASHQSSSEELNFPDSGSKEAEKPVKYDNFFSPKNTEFYDRKPYKPLSTELKEIRLLRLFGGSGSDPIICSIYDNTPIESVTDKYLALSYFAGDHRQTAEILVNDIIFNVFAGLSGALRRIRRTEDFLQGRPHLIWVDQICINQSDTQERANQVLLMKDIYHNCGRVMVWLGEAEDGDDLNFLKNQYDNVKMILDAVQKEEPPEEGDSKESDKNNTDDGDVKKAKDSPEAMLDFITTMLAADFLDNVENEEFIEGWKSLRGFASSPWWSRGWICQEIIVGRCATILFGDSAMDWQEFCMAWPMMPKAAQAFMQAILDDNSLVDGPPMQLLKNCGVQQFGRIDFLLETQKAWHKSSSQNIRPMLEAGRSCQVTDPRDRIYAFLGLVDPEYRIVPNYEAGNGLADVFCHVAKRTILFEQSLDMLSHAQENERALNSKLPSWVPDWSVKRDRAILQTEIPRFRASGDYKSAASFGKGPASKDGPVLRVQCLIIDQLARKDTLRTPVQDEDPGHVREEWVSLLSSEVGDLGPFVEPMANVLWRGEGGVLSSPSEETQDSTGQTARLNTAIKNNRKALVDESLGGNWSFFISPKKYMGLAHCRAKYTDLICILLGASVPFVLRPEEKHYRLVGEAFVHGLMDGEAIAMMRRGEVKVHTIDIW